VLLCVTHCRRLSESFIVNTAEELSNQHIHSTTGTDNDTATAATAAATTAGQHSVDDGSGSTNTDTSSATTSSHTFTAHPYARGSRSDLLSRLRAQSASGKHQTNFLMLLLTEVSFSATTLIVSIMLQRYQRCHIYLCHLHASCGPA
jgi:hypothetical protein